MAEQWCRQHDGYEEAEGSETEFGGRKIRTWTMEEIMRSAEGYLRSELLPAKSTIAIDASTHLLKTGILDSP